MRWRDKEHGGAAPLCAGGGAASETEIIPPPRGMPCSSAGGGRRPVHQKARLWREGVAVNRQLLDKSGGGGAKQLQLAARTLSKVVIRSRDGADDANRATMVAWSCGFWQCVIYYQ